ncbi:hypothetical protein BpHYR1_042055 [Brachionus plicatilis]|uniref:Uncharacterized protein n=1 Tax=Brachionus plicatilis TaxID=10195 RepID=A0A3M7Q5B5_BRAPC|nr:hypothetical protein BpHYR1_042055 [Brachionus plicatilis]
MDFNQPFIHIWDRQCDKSPIFTSVLNCSRFTNGSYHAQLNLDLNEFMLHETNNNPKFNSLFQNFNIFLNGT